MEVSLYVYDLSKGLARQMSRDFLGIQIDAVYHTAVVFGGVEYLYGAGVQTCVPGSTHHGQPMEIIPLGITSLPMDVIAEYLESLKQIYTIESYDLFLHNCNNFSNDFATFLVGKGIPEHITSLPQTVLNTPFGQMLRPALDNAMRSVTQAPLPPASAIPQRGDVARPIAASTNGVNSKPASNGIHSSQGKVHNVTSLRELDTLLASASKSCATIFFTAATCPPCKLVYPAYDELAAEAGNKAVLIKVDTTQAYEIASQYSIRATPTFITFLKGQRENEWTGASESQLRGNIGLLINMAHPAHPHTTFKFPTLRSASTSPIIFGKLPPLEKLILKMGNTGIDPIIQSVKKFLTLRAEAGPSEASIPNLSTFAEFIITSFNSLPVVSLFPLIDLFRCTLVDPRVSGYFAEERDHKTIITLLNLVNTKETECPYPMRLVTLQACCNLWSTTLYPEAILTKPLLRDPTITLITSSLLDDKHPVLRVAAASLSFNIAAYVQLQRRDDSGREALAEEEQCELVASLLEAIRQEEASEEAMRGLLLSVGFLVYLGNIQGEVAEMCKVLDAESVVHDKLKSKAFKAEEKLIKEIAELLGRSLKG
ncbi:MAG: hypothetical protein M1824_001870 [Vezdaea acicularis]|nr:MAG: hypothetical protein M1824_001870 [Vezdaea acicularis]